MSGEPGPAHIAQYGYTGASVWGYPVDGAGNNCTNYAAFRLSRNGASNAGNLGNAGDWASNAGAKGFAVNGVPAVGAIAQWNFGSAYAPQFGHVAYVEEVTASDIALSDSNWQGGSKRWRVSRGDRQWPSNFLHIRDVAGGVPLPPSGRRPASDVNGDGRADILWLEGTRLSVVGGQADGRLGQFQTSNGPIGKPDWAGVGDVNGDGRADILWLEGTRLSVVGGQADGRLGQFQTSNGPIGKPDWGAPGYAPLSVAGPVARG